MTDVTTRARTWMATGYGLGTHTVWAHMMGVKDFYVDHPHDKGDFKRLLDLLQAVPEWEERIHEMSALSPAWAEIAARWKDLKDDPAGIRKLVEQPKPDENPVSFRILAFMARSSQPSVWADVLAEYADLPFDDRVNAWVVGNDVGSSSKTIWAVMLGIDPGNEGSHPHDPGDLGRCLRLLELMPEWKPRLPELAAQSPEWKALVERWGELASFMDGEVGIAWEKAKSAPKTYNLMKVIAEAARKN